MKKLFFNIGYFAMKIFNKQDKTVKAKCLLGLLLILEVHQIHLIQNYVLADTSVSQDEYSPGPDPSILGQHHIGFVLRLVKGIFCPSS